MKKELLFITAIGTLSVNTPLAWAEDIESRIEISAEETLVLNNVAGRYRLSDEGNGGIIGNAGTVIIDQASFFKKNYLYDFAGGVLSNTGKATINNTSFLSNKAEQGGAIYNNSIIEGDSLTITNSVLTGNQAYDWSPNPQGGAIYNDRGKIKILNSTFTDNNAQGTAVSSGGASITVDSSMREIRPRF